MIPDIEGTPHEADFSRQIGNQLYMTGSDIEECELGKRIYFEGEVELSERERQCVIKATEGYSYVARTAITKALEAQA